MKRQIMATSLYPCNMMFLIQISQYVDTKCVVFLPSWWKKNIRHLKKITDKKVYRSYGVDENGGVRIFPRWKYYAMRAAGKVPIQRISWGNYQYPQDAAKT